MLVSCLSKLYSWHHPVPHNWNTRVLERRYASSVVVLFFFCSPRKEEAEKEQTVAPFFFASSAHLVFAFRNAANEVNERERVFWRFSFVLRLVFGLLRFGFQGPAEPLVARPASTHRQRPLIGRRPDDRQWDAAFGVGGSMTS